MLAYCWPTVCNAGPTLDQRWVNAAYLLGKTHQPLSYPIQFFTHLKLCHTAAPHNLKCLNSIWNYTTMVCMHLRREFFVKYRREWYVNSIWRIQWSLMLLLGHGSSPQYWLSHVDWEEIFFVSFKPPRPGTEPRTLAWKAAVLTTTLGPPPPGYKNQNCEEYSVGTTLKNVM